MQEQPIWGIPAYGMEEKRFASIPAIFGFLSAQGSEKLSVGFVYSPLKSVGNSCYFGSLQTMCRVIFLQQHWVSFMPIPKILPSFCKVSIYLSLPLFFPWCLLLSLSYYPTEVSQTTGGFPNTQFEALWSTRKFFGRPY